LDPEILLVDEVLAVGDAAFQRKCLGRMREDAVRGRTVLMVTHNMPAVVQMCRRALWLDGGRVRLDGAPQRVVEAYLADGAAHGAERRWTDPETAPGDERVRLLAARVLQGGEVAPFVDVNAPVEVEMEYAVLRDATDLVTAANFFDAQGTCLFASADWRPNRHPAGTYRKRVTVPAHVFAEGRVDVLLQLVFYSPHVQSAVVPSAVSFTGTDSDHPDTVRGPYKGAWPGVVRLRLSWGDAAPTADAR
jgi:lipopolysaccharide transport system ATP-binding protein